MTHVFKTRRKGQGAYIVVMYTKATRYIKSYTMDAKVT